MATVSPLSQPLFTVWTGIFNEHHRWHRQIQSTPHHWLRRWYTQALVNGVQLPADQMDWVDGHYQVLYMTDRQLLLPIGPQLAYLAQQ